MNKKLWRTLFLSLLLIVFTAQMVAALPPRPDVEAPSPGARIQLQLSNATTGSDGVWTLIQWQDAQGDWHTVDGWQGSVELDGTQIWWLDAAYFGAGPFRWNVLAQKDGSLQATSDSFFLPDSEGTILVVPLSVAN